MIDHDYEKRLTSVLSDCEYVQDRVSKQLFNILLKHFGSIKMCGYLPDGNQTVPFPEESDTTKHFLLHFTFTCHYASYKDFLKTTAKKIKRFRSNSPLYIRNNILQVHRDFTTGDIIVQCFLRGWVVNAS